MLEEHKIPGQGRGQGQDCCSLGTLFYQIHIKHLPGKALGRKTHSLVLKGAPGTRKPCERMKAWPAQLAPKQSRPQGQAPHTPHSHRGVYPASPHLPPSRTHLSPSLPGAAALCFLWAP